MVTNHLSRLMDWKKKELPLDGYFPEDKIFTLIQNEVPWYVAFVYYLAVGVFPMDMNYQCKKSYLMTLSIITRMDLCFLREVPTKSFGGVFQKKRWEVL